MKHIRSKTGKVHAVSGSVERIGNSLWKGRTTIVGQLTEEPVSCQVCSWSTYFLYVKRASH